MIEKSSGISSSEKYLSNLGKKSFLSLWSYSNVFYAPGKELADLLVICGNDIIIFQDKWSLFPEAEDLEQSWKRWFNRTVSSGAKQAWGAERRLKAVNSKLFLDAACATPIPIPFPKAEEAIFHLIVVTHGGSKKCRELMGGSGSFMMRNDIKNLQNHLEPFVIGDLDPTRSYVHVLDDTTLDVLMRTLDTITDFTLYLRKKEALLRSKMGIFAAGDEELLSNYLKHVNKNNEHDFDFGPGAQGLSILALGEGGWESFIKNPQRVAQIEQNKISYVWDRLIETFNKHAIEGTQYSVPELKFVEGIEAAEKIVRFMAKEPRFMRRVLSLGIKEMLETTLETQRRVRIISSFLKDGPHYVILLFPIPKTPPISHDEYRKVRAIFLEGICLVAKMKYPNMKHIVGIATESGLPNDGRSEDAMYLDKTELSPAMLASAKKFQDDFSVLLNPTQVAVKEREYPEIPSKEEFLKNPRNKRCPCGSGKKYKYCCLEKGREFYK